MHYLQVTVTRGMNVSENVSLDGPLNVRSFCSHRVNLDPRSML